MRTTIYLFLTFAFFSSCVTEAADYETFEVFPRQVEIVGSDQDSVKLLVNMYIGPNLCYQYRYNTSELDDHTQKIRFIAERPTPTSGAQCFQQLSHIVDTLAVKRLDAASDLKIKLESGTDTTISLTE
jgi:hypothetical protein